MLSSQSVRCGCCVCVVAAAPGEDRCGCTRIPSLLRRASSTVSTSRERDRRVAEGYPNCRHVVVMMVCVGMTVCLYSRVQCESLLFAPTHQIGRTAVFATGSTVAPPLIDTTSESVGEPVRSFELGTPQRHIARFTSPTEYTTALAHFTRDAPATCRVRVPHTAPPCPSPPAHRTAVADSTASRPTPTGHWQSAATP